jgi:hypothetical protein
VAVRPILAHPGGVWRESGARLLNFRIGGSMTGVPSTGTLHVIFPFVTVVKFQHTVRSKQIRIRVADNLDVYEDYYRIKPFIGSFYPFGKRSSFGGTESLEPNQDVTTLRGGSRLVRRNGPPRRSVQLQWTDVIPTNVATASPDYVAAASGAGYAGLALRNEPGMIEGAIRRAQGAKHPCIYLPRVATGSDTVTLTGREFAMYARIVGGTQRTNARGVPGGRLDVNPTLDLEEEV